MSLYTSEEILTFCGCLKQWGTPAQVLSFCEEFGEAIKAINHHLRGKEVDGSALHVIEELVDLHILSKQMALLVVSEEFTLDDVEQAWKFWMKEKLGLIQGRLRMENTNGV